jgi:hypothetical protein
MEIPNSIFCKMFAWSMTKYDRTSADDHEANCTTMALEWHPSQGFELLVMHLFQGATFANLVKHLIPNNDIVDIGIHIIHQTGLFEEEYKTWITRGDNPTNNMDFAAFRTYLGDRRQHCVLHSHPGLATRLWDGLYSWMILPTYKKSW